MIIKKKTVLVRHEDDPQLVPLGDVFPERSDVLRVIVVTTGRQLQSASDGKPVASSTDTDFIPSSSIQTHSEGALCLHCLLYMCKVLP